LSRAVLLKTLLDATGHAQVNSDLAGLRYFTVS
jgi:hypothetical protein